MIQAQCLGKSSKGIRKCLRPGGEKWFFKCIKKTANSKLKVQLFMKHGNKQIKFNSYINVTTFKSKNKMNYSSIDWFLAPQGQRFEFIMLLRSGQTLPICLAIELLLFCFPSIMGSLPIIFSTVGVLLTCLMYHSPAGSECCDFTCFNCT